jgi:tetratricopeptide (TPR) repeat protein
MTRDLADGRVLPRPILTRIAERSEGVPLFVEEVTRAILESGALKLENGRYDLAGPWDDRLIPNTVQASIVARFDRLGESRALAQLCAAIGREFSHAMLLKVSDIPEPELVAQLRHLCASDLAFTRGVATERTYSFKHALIQDAIYQTLPKRERAAHHARIFEALVQEFPEVVDQQPEVAAYHAENAGRFAEAVPLFKQAGERALAKTAAAEAVRQLKRGVELVGSLPESERSAVELDLNLALALGYMMTLGWASREVEHAICRVRDLASERAEALKLYVATWGLWSLHLLRGELDTSLSYAEKVAEMGRAAGNITLELVGRAAVGNTQLYRGEYHSSADNVKAAMAHFDLETERQIAAMVQISSGVGSFLVCAQAQQMLGRGSEANDLLAEGRIHLENLRHVTTRANYLCQECRIRHAAGDVNRLREAASATLALSLDEGFAMWIPIVEVFLAWADAKDGGDALAAAERIRTAQHRSRETLMLLGQLEFTSCLAEVLLLAHRPLEALAAAESALSSARTRKEHDFEPELLRFMGDATWALGDLTRAQAFYWESVTCARSQSAKIFELRTILSLTKLLGIGATQDNLRAALSGMSEFPGQTDMAEAQRLLDAFTAE